MSKSVGFDTFKDFTPISQAVGAPLYLVANSELGVDTTAALVEYAKKNPGKLNYGSVGRGSVFHFQGEAMKVAAGIDMLHVPYTGANNANIIGDLSGEPRAGLFPGLSGDARGAADRQDQAARRVLRSAHQAAARPADREGGAARTSPRCRRGSASWGRPGCRRRSSPGSKPKSARRWRIRRYPASSKRSASLRSAARRAEMADRLRKQTDELARLAKQVGIEPN